MSQNEGQIIIEILKKIDMLKDIYGGIDLKEAMDDRDNIETYAQELSKILPKIEDMSASEYSKAVKEVDIDKLIKLVQHHVINRWHSAVKLLDLEEKKIMNSNTCT